MKRRGFYKYISTFPVFCFQKPFPLPGVHQKRAGEGQKGALGNLSSTRHASQTFFYLNKQKCNICLAPQDTPQTFFYLFKQKCNICLAPPDTPQINKRKQCFQDLGICLYLSLGSWEGCIFSFALPEKKSIPGIWALNQVVFCCLFHLFSVFAFVFVFVFSFIFLWRMGWLSGRL